MSANQVLLKQLAENKIEQVITQLLSITKSDADLNGEVTQISARFQQNENQRRLNLADSDEINREYAKIRNALLSIINRLPDSGGVLPVVKKQNWLAIGAFIVGLIAVLANIATIKDVFFKKEEIKTPATVVESPKVDIKPTVPVEKPIDKVIEPPVNKKEKTNKQSDGTIIFNNTGKMEKTVVGNGNKVDIH